MRNTRILSLGAPACSNLLSNRPSPQEKLPGGPNAQRRASSMRMGGRTFLTNTQFEMSVLLPELCAGSFPVVEYVIQYEKRSMVPGGAGDDDEESHDWVEIRCGTTSCKLDNLLASTDYAVRVAACNEPQGQGAVSVCVCVCVCARAPRV